MFIEVRGHHVEVTLAIESYVSEKLQRLNKHNQNITTVSVLLKMEKDNDQKKYKAEGTIKFKGNQEIFVGVKSKDMYKSIDELLDKLDRKVIAEKERHQK